MVTSRWAHARCAVWATFLFMFFLAARASDASGYCPLVEDIVFPQHRSDWAADGLPKYVEVAYTNWKGRNKNKKGQKYYLRLWRNPLANELFPVYWLMLHLTLSGRRRGAIFGPCTAQSSDAEREKASKNLQTRLKSLFTYFSQEVDAALGDCTSHSLRRSGASWMARCGAQPWQIRCVGRWRSIEQVVAYVQDGQFQASLAAGSDGVATDDIWNVLPWKAACWRNFDNAVLSKYL